MWVEREEHRLAFAYPENLVSAARRAAQEVLTRVQAGEPPFDVATAAPWLELMEGVCDPEHLPRASEATPRWSR